MEYRLFGYINDVELIIDKLIKDKRQDASQYLIQRLFYTYIRLGDVIEGGDNLNNALENFVNVFTASPFALESRTCENLWYCVIVYKSYVRSLWNEISYLHRLTNSVKNEYFRNIPTDNFFKTISQLNMGLEGELLNFNIDFYTALGYDGHDDFRETPDGMRSIQMRFEYKVAEDGKAQLIDFEFPIPDSDDEIRYKFDKVIKQDAIPEKEDIHILLARFISRKTLSTMKLTHKKISSLLSRYWSDSKYLNALDLKIIHTPDLWKFPPGQISFPQLTSSFDHKDKS
jgi:hypothetical protein